MPVAQILKLPDGQRRIQRPQSIGDIGSPALRFPWTMACDGKCRDVQHETLGFRARAGSPEGARYGAGIRLRRQGPLAGPPGFLTNYEKDVPDWIVGVFQARFFSACCAGRRLDGMLPQRKGALRPVLLAGFLDLVEAAPADACTLAGQADVVDCLGRGQKLEPGLDKPLWRS